MGKVYPDDAQGVNDQLRQSVNETSCLYVRVPLEVVLDHDKRATDKHPEGESVPDGAKLLLGEVFCLQARYGVCDATDAHFERRLGKSRATVQEYIAILTRRGYLRVISDGHNRELRVAERFLNVKDRPRNQEDGGNRPENRTDDGANRPKGQKVGANNRPENQTDSNSNRPENQDGNGANRPENRTYKTPESEESKETKNSESQSRPFFNSLSDEDREEVGKVWELFGRKGSVSGYEALLKQCAGRRETWEIAVLSAKIEQAKRPLNYPSAWMRKVIAENLELDKDAVADRLDAMRRNYETPEQRQEIDARERQAEADQAAHQAPPVPAVQGLIEGAVKGMPFVQGIDNERKWSPPSPSASTVRHVSLSETEHLILACPEKAYQAEFDALPERQELLEAKARIMYPKDFQGYETLRPRQQVMVKAAALKTWTDKRPT